MLKQLLIFFEFKRLAKVKGEELLEDDEVKTVDFSDMPTQPKKKRQCRLHG